MIDRIGNQLVKRQCQILRNQRIELHVLPFDQNAALQATIQRGKALVQQRPDRGTLPIMGNENLEAARH